MVSFGTLIQTYYVTRRNKRSSADSVAYELHWQRNLLRLQKDLNDHTLQPTAYTFITPKPRPREVFACDMSMRIVHHYIDIRMRPLIEKRLTERTYNNRKGKGLNACIKQVVTDIYDKTEGFTRDAWLITWDLQGYFPNANQDIVYSQFEDIVLHDYEGDDTDDLLYMVQRSIYSYPTLHCEIRSTPEERRKIKPEKCLFNKPLGIGGAIGHLLWQNAMNLYLAKVDMWIQEDCGLLHVRFVDDNHAVTDNKEAFLTYMMPELRNRYREYGCTMHPHKFYCQHYTKGVTFCGQTVKMQRVYAAKKTERALKAKIQAFRGRVREDKVTMLLSSLNSYLGILKNCNGHAVAMRCLDRMDPEWERLVTLDRKRMCLVATKGHGLNERIKNKYHLKLRRNDTGRERKQVAKAA